MFDTWMRLLSDVTDALIYKLGIYATPFRFVRNVVKQSDLRYLDGFFT